MRDLSLMEGDSYETARYGSRGLSGALDHTGHAGAGLSALALWPGASHCQRLLVLSELPPILSRLRRNQSRTGVTSRSAVSVSPLSSGGAAHSLLDCRIHAIPDSLAVSRATGVGAALFPSMPRHFADGLFDPLCCSQSPLAGLRHPPVSNGSVA